MIKCSFLLALLALAVSISALPLVAFAQPDTVCRFYFPTGRSDLSAQNLGLLNRTGALADSIFITGYADSVGSSAFNEQLSLARSVSVSHFLKEHYPGVLLFSAAYGERFPASRNDLSLNRRVDIRVHYRKAVAEQKDTVIKNTVLEFSDILFQPDKAVIEPASLPLVREAAARLKTFDCARFEIIGYVNWIPVNKQKSEAGMKEWVRVLSEQRAREICLLFAAEGIPEHTMTYVGKGNEDLKFDHPATDDEKRQNMRVRVSVQQRSPCTLP